MVLKTNMKSEVRKTVLFMFSLSLPLCLYFSPSQRSAINRGMDEESAVSSRYRDDPSLTIPRSGTSSRSESKRRGMLELFPLRTISLKEKQAHTQVQINIQWDSLSRLQNNVLQNNETDEQHNKQGYIGKTSTQKICNLISPTQILFYISRSLTSYTVSCSIYKEKQVIYFIKK